MKSSNISIFTLEFTDAQLAEISAALMNHPFGKAAPIVSEINRQIMAQQKPTIAPAEDEPK